MRSAKFFLFAAVMALPAVAGAQDPEYARRTYLTFSAPIALPGVTLQAGTYTFEIGDPETTRKVIQVDSRDGKTHYGYFLTMPIHRVEASDDPVVMFRESAANTPRAVRAWFYPGNRDGYEFVYPYDQATRIASASHEPVLATHERLDQSSKAQIGAVKEETIARVNENGQSSATQAQTTTTTERSSSSSAANLSNSSAAPRDSSVTSTAVGTSGAQRRTLPKTASGLELTELLSALSLGGAFAVRSFRLRRPH
jgi:hypothetical protein